MIKKTLFEISSPKQWKTVSCDMLTTSGYPVYGANGVIGYYSTYNHDKETLLITCRGATCGSLNICQPFSYVNGNAMALDNLSDEVDIKYLYYYLFNRGLDDVVTGSAQPQIVRQSLEKIFVEYPSLDIQQNVVSALEKVDTVISTRKRQCSILNELVKSRFVEMFGEPMKNSKEWCTAPLDEVAPARQFRGELKDDIWLLNLDAVEAQTGAVLFKQRVSCEEINASTVYFTTANVLYSKLRPYLNKVIMPDEDGVATSELIPMYPMPGRLNRTYLCHWLRSDAFVSHISEKVAGAKMPRVSMDYFRSLTIELPPIELQEYFAAFVEQIEKSKSKIQKSLEKLETLKKSLMQKYFG
ncbi:MAG: restriction endonuclease subunit S [Clostridia bacterium]|nr:restriction endonuclease subunit S [Clostridia bacterium]